MNSSELLQVYLGQERSRLALEYLEMANCKLLLKKPRKSKLGDFSVRAGNKQITINKDLNPYRFILTFIHEIAHLMTFQNHKWKHKPHGMEWQMNFRNLLDLWKIKELFRDTEELEQLFLMEYNRPSACSGIHLEKEKILREYDVWDNKTALTEVAENQRFTFNDREYQKGQLRRTRYLCQRTSDGKLYSIHKATRVVTRQ